MKTRFAKLEWTEEGAVTRWPNGKSWGAFPHDSAHYHALAYRLGYEGDTLAYCREHELAHHLVAEHFGSRSVVLWNLANGRSPSPRLAASEEALAMALQRYARANEVPLIAGVDWEALRGQFLNLLETENGTDKR